MKFELSESPIYLEGLWYWVDINKGLLCCTDDFGNVTYEPFDEPISNIVEMDGKRLLVSGSKGLYVYSREEKKVIKQFSLQHGNAMRCNDGSVGPDGNYYFGTMEKSPTGLNGSLYSVSSKGEVNDLKVAIGIPNSFIWLDDTNILITDSFLQKTFKVTLLERGKLDWVNRKVWIDLSGSDFTPDGGCLDSEGNVWIAIWGKACIHKYSKEAELIEVIELSALQPTSCAFGGAEMNELLITTAYEGLNEVQLTTYSDSGKVLLKTTNTKGTNPFKFKLEE